MLGGAERIEFTPYRSPREGAGDRILASWMHVVEEPGIKAPVQHRAKRARNARRQRIPARCRFRQ